MKVLTLSFLLVLPVGVFAEDAPKFELTTVQITNPAGPEFGLKTYGELSLGTNRLVFVPPGGWNGSADATRRVLSYSSADRNARITLQFAPTRNPAAYLESRGEKATPEKIKSAVMDAQRQLVLQTYPGAKITEEQECYASGVTGYAYTFEIRDRESGGLRGQVGFVPSEAGELQIFCATNEKNNEAANAFRFFVASLKVQKSDKPLVLD